MTPQLSNNLTKLGCQPTRCAIIRTFNAFAKGNFYTNYNFFRFNSICQISAKICHKKIDFDGEIVSFIEYRKTKSAVKNMIFFHHTF